MSSQMMPHHLRIIGGALFFLILETNLLFFSVGSYFCYNDHGNYTRNSTYSNNLHTLLSSIPTNISAYGFYNGSFGSRNPDIAYAIALCRADVQPQSCRDCVQGLTTGLQADCPNQRQAFGLEDFCMLRYSDKTNLGFLEIPKGVYVYDDQNATNPGEFMRDVRGLLLDLAGQAAGGSSLMKVAARNAKGPDSQDIYALVQCTPDLSLDQCSSCLIDATAGVMRYCHWSTGARVFRTSCYLRYETYLFYNETRLQELGAMPRPAPAPRPPLAPGTPSSSTPGPINGNNTRRTIISVVVSIAVLVIILAVFVFILWRRRIKVIKQRPEERHETDQEITTVESLKYTLTAIRASTNDFSDDNKLGEGGFGAVYKGKLSNGQEVAVKRLSRNSGQGDLEFKNEVQVLAKLQHKYLVRLLGFCIEGVEKLLIYEFVQNASLDKFIFDPIKRSLCLDWEKRHKIIGGIARGILYLHEDSQIRIIHRDLKPSNVLLDGSMNPKIADFGMARLFEQDETQENTNKIAGTFGYMAPEYARHGIFSVKSDVFSFGVLVLEIISGRKNNDVRDGEMVEGLLSLAWKNWKGRTPAALVDPNMKYASDSIIDIVRCIHIGLLCVQKLAADRPTMASVALMLNGVSLTLPVPTEPAFYTPNDSRGCDYKNSSNTNVQTQSETSSRNEASITDLYPR